MSSSVRRKGKPGKGGGKGSSRGGRGGRSHASKSHGGGEGGGGVLVCELIICILQKIIYTCCLCRLKKSS